MHKSDIIFRFTFYITFAVVLISFIGTFYIQFSSMKIMENFLTSSAVAGFIAIFAQFATTLVQEYYKRKTYKVCMICKKSQFSLSIATSVREYYSKKVDVTLHVELLDPAHDPEIQMNNFLSKEAYEYDGLIIRPLNVSDSFAAKINILLNRGKKIILTDLNLDKAQLESMNTNELPFYVGSDFKFGGNLISNYIIELVEEYKKDVDVVLFLGPTNTVSARKRGKALLWDLSINNVEIQSILELDSFKEEHCIKLFSEVCNIQKNNSKNLIIFCANDNIAKKLIEIYYFSDNLYPSIKERFSIFENIVFIGYDGIKNNDGSYLLDNYKVDYATVDVDPEKQGEISAKIMVDKLMGNVKSYSTEELVEPKFFEHKEKNKHG